MKKFTYNGNSVTRPLIVDNIKVEEKNLNPGMSDDNLVIGENHKYGAITIEKKVEKSNSNGTISRDVDNDTVFRFALLDNDLEKYISVTSKDANGNFVANEKPITNNGICEISNIPYGSYTLYELYQDSQFTEYDITDKYMLEIQPGYDSVNKRVKVATITVDDIITIELEEDTKKDSNGTQYRYVLENQEAKANATENSGAGPKISISMTNHKYVNISGYVWEDIPNSKANQFNDLYDGEEQGITDAYNGLIDSSNSFEKLITDNKNLSIKLVKINGNTVMRENPTNIENNIYTFKNINAANLKDYYVVFDYQGYNENYSALNNEYSKRNQYITCVPYLSKQESIDLNSTSKALLNSDQITVRDSELIEQANTGTYLEKVLNDNEIREILYDEDTSTIHSINLGIKRLPDTDYSISNNLAQAIVYVNGHRFVYQYGDKGIDGVEGDSNASAAIPNVNWQSQTDSLAYTRSIYPSDIYTLSYNDNDKKIKIHVVYKITITNNTNYNISNLYVEDNLKLAHLENISDLNRYSEKVDVNDQPWGIYSKSRDEEGNMQGISMIKESEREKTIADSVNYYITLSVDEEEIINILNGERYEKFPTKAISRAYHNYHRDDYYWNWNDNKTNAELGKTERQRHLTKTVQKSDEAPYLRLKLAEDRIISGKVFEDSIDMTGKEEGEVLGNGKYDENENSISNIKVELGRLDDDGNFNVVNLYPKDKVLNGFETEKDANGNDKFKKVTEDGKTKWKIKDGYSFDQAKMDTNNSGEYRFVGILPDEYYLRFTYGDGRQQLYDNSGNAVNLKTPNNKTISDSKISAEDYKSTIITNSNIKEACKSSIERYKEDSRGLWYLDLSDNINCAIDQNIDFNNYEAFNLSTSTQYYRQTSAITPMLDIGIENIKFNETNKFRKCNVDSITGDVMGAQKEVNNIGFALIKKPEVRLQIRKEITRVKWSNNGEIIFNINPIEASSQNVSQVTNLDSVWSKTGSTYTKIEMENYIYGSELEIEYQLTVLNSSDISYDSLDYYKYGEKNGANLSTIKISKLLDYPDVKFKKIYSTASLNNKEIQDVKTKGTNKNNDEYFYSNALKALDEKYNLDNDYPFDNVYTIDILNGDSSKSDGNTKTCKNQNLKLDGTLDLSDENVKQQYKDSYITFNVTSNYLNSKSDDTEFMNYAQVFEIMKSNSAYRISTSYPLSEEKTEFFANKVEYNKYIPTSNSAKLIETPSTGENMSLYYVIVGSVILSIIGGVIFILKKRFK